VPKAVRKKAETTTLSMPKSSNTTPSKEAGPSPAFHPFDPIVDETSRILILGSFPSLKSFENNFYYAHPRNQFWLILSKIYGMPADTTEARLKLLKKNRIALWDVIKGCERTNSADSNLKACKPNDIDMLLRDYPNIKMIFFTGRKAQTLFKRFFPDNLLPQYLLPSPSPAYAAMPFEDKLRVWRKMFDVV